MSVSTLLNIEACPRRWSLSLSEYPEIWERSGYPPKPYIATLAGQVIHSSLELITNSLDQAGCASTQDPLFVTVLRKLGGFSHIVKTKIEQVVSSLSVNPRAQNIVGQIASRLRAKLPELRTRLQMIIGKLPIQNSGGINKKSKRVSNARIPLTAGMHAEVELRAADLRWHGFVDLINIGSEACEIIDFKTGEADQDHEFQARVYNLLWSRDTDLNPTGRSVDRLVLSYFDSEVEISPQDELALTQFESELISRTQASLKLIQEEPPLARPSLQNCRFCPVRQICNDYWIESTQRKIAAERREESSIGPENTFADFEVKLHERQTLTRWRGEVVAGDQISPGTAVHIQFTENNMSLLTALKIGNCLRLIEANLINQSADQTSQEWFIILHSMSEAYFL